MNTWSAHCCKNALPMPFRPFHYHIIIIINSSLVEKLCRKRASCDLPDFCLWSFPTILLLLCEEPPIELLVFAASSQRKLSNNMERHLHFYRLQIVSILTRIYVHFCTWPGWQAGRHSSSTSFELNRVHTGLSINSSQQRWTISDNSSGIRLAN